MSSSRRSNASEARRSDFKNQGLTPDEFRRRREETSVELRKAKKEDSLNKRRSILGGGLAEDDFDAEFSTETKATKASSSAVILKATFCPRISLLIAR